jgi:hypothetical protein
MTVTLSELLTLAGRLDDDAGFDTPRERFRRFLTGHVTSAQAARTLIEQCQHAPGDQHHRALQDLVVMLGRCLGFETRFGSYHDAGGGRKPDGHWHSRRLDIALEIRTDLTEATDLDALSRSIAALSSPPYPGVSGRALGLCVLTPLYAGRGRLEEIRTTASHDSRVRIAALKSLVHLAGMVGSRRLAHDDVVRLLGSDLDLDFLVELLERSAGEAAGADDPSATSGSALFEMEAGPGYWLATIGADQGTTPEQFVELVVGKRRILGLGQGGTPHGVAQPGDRICLHIPGKGVVGHCQVRSIEESGAGIRGAQRFSQLLQIEDPVLRMDAPVPLDERMQLRVRAARGSRDGAAHSVTRISRQEFDTLAMIRVALEERRGRGPAFTRSDAEPAELPVSVGDSRSPE